VRNALLRARLVRLACLCAPALLFAVSPCPAGMVASAVVGDDTITSTLLPLKFMSSYGQNVIGPDGTLVSTGMFDQVLANAGFTPQNGWTINYGSFTLPTSGTVTVNTYDAWVGTPPTNTGLDGKKRQISPPPGASWPQEAAGATIQIEVTYPAEVKNIHFIQMLTQGFNSNNHPSSKLDNPTSGSPYYDQGAVAFTNVTMTDNKFGSWFQDTPDVFEQENADPFWNIPLTWTATFDEAIVTESAGPNGTKVLTIWGGVEWGFKATIIETPEPATLFPFASGTVVLAALRWRRRGR